MAEAHPIRHPANFKDLTGLKFGRLTILSHVPNGASKTKWYCCCECGTHRTVIGSDLKSGKTKSCGCLSSDNTIKSNVARGGHTKDLTGLVVGYLTVESQAEKLNGVYAWNCQCRCGNRVVVRAFSLIGKKTSKSCGCRIVEAATTHGLSTGADKFIYDVHRQMLDRCTNRDNAGFPNYGGRGISVCQRWLSIENFVTDVGCPPSRKHSLDRFPDNNGNYSCGICDDCKSHDWPTNWRWATRTEQNRNRRGNRMITFQGETLCLAEWAERIGLRTQALWLRLESQGWTVERALTTPKAKRFV